MHAYDSAIQVWIYSACVDTTKRRAFQLWNEVWQFGKYDDFFSGGDLDMRQDNALVSASEK